MQESSLGLLERGGSEAKGYTLRASTAVSVVAAVAAINGVLASAVMVSYTVVDSAAEDDEQLGWMDRIGRVVLDPGDFVQGIDLGKDTHYRFTDASTRSWLLLASAILMALSVAVLVISSRRIAPMRDRLCAPLHRTARVSLPVCRKTWTVPRTTMVAWLVQAGILLWLIWPPYKCYYVGDSDVEECGHPWPPPIGDADRGADLTNYAHRTF